MLRRLEQIGNRLPDPVTIFVGGCLLIALAAAWAASSGWQVSAMEPVMGADGQIERWQTTDTTLEARSILTSEGIWWALSSLKDNFMNFPPLGVVLVGMLGIGIAERSGLIGDLLTRLAKRLPSVLLVPATVLLGILSSLTMDAGYVVLPPLAAALFYAAGRSPVAGIAAVFAGVSAGFSANLVPSNLDTMMAEFSTTALQSVQPDRAVSAVANLYFLQVSTILLTLAGWWTTSRWVEPALANRVAESDPITPPESAETPTAPAGSCALTWAAVAFALTALVFLLTILIPGAPLHGDGERFPRWQEAIVPMLLFGLLMPGIAYGIAAGSIRSDRDLATMFVDTMRAMAPIIVLAFFAAQFISWFSYSRLDGMLAMWGGQRIMAMGLPTGSLLIAFILVVMVMNLFIGSMSAKYALLAPVFLPMLMMAGISPELTQAAYRVGDSTTNIITPLNAYLILILGTLKMWQPKAGLGNLIAVMLPYTIVFSIVWIALLLGWLALGLPLGPS